jgi:glycosyltransferase involved in cell wall biosynthesis
MAIVERELEERIAEKKALRRLRIAMIGIRGVPATYGGLEECAEQVGVRLVQRGHEVFVYCRKGTYDDAAKYYKGIRRIVLPSLKTKITDTYSHTLLGMLHLLGEKPDVILAFNPGIASLCAIPKLCGHKIALNPDGFDWKREKWGWFAKRFIHLSAWICTKVVDQMIIDAVSVKDYYNQTFACNPPAIYIPNGSPVEPPEESDATDEQTEAILRHYGLEKQKYILFLSRHEPENSCQYIIEAFEGLDTKMKLFFGGGASYQSPYAQSLRNNSDPRIAFPGAIYDPLHVKVLHHNCYFLVHGNQPGGTSLGLLKAMGLGTCALSLNTPDNAYAVKQAGCLYELDVDDLRRKMRYLLDNPRVVGQLREKAVQRVREEYLWDVVTDRYEEVLYRLALGTEARTVSQQSFVPVTNEEKVLCQ